MPLLVDLFGFLSVVLRGFTLGFTGIAIGGVVFRRWAIPFAAHSIEPVLRQQLMFIQRGSAIALVIVAFASKSLDVSILVSTIGVTWRSALTAPFVLAGLATCSAGIVLATTARLPAKWLELIAAAVLLGSLVVTTHATGRLTGRTLLLAFSALHQAGGAAWIGGLPYFLLALAAPFPVTVRAAIARRFSTICVCAVLAIALSAAVKYSWYLESVPALYGTAYGLMTSTKGFLFLTLLCFGAGNFWAVRRMATDHAAVSRTRRFVEIELVLGIAIYLVTGSLTSLPPAVDLPNDRVTWDRIVERMSPRTPRLTSPKQADLWYAIEQVRLNRLAAAAHEQAPRALVPGDGVLPERTAADIGWSEFNHNWSGIFVLSIGLLSLLARRSFAPWARHWPIIFVALGLILLFYRDS